MVIGVGGPAFRVTTKSALYWVGAFTRGSVVSSAGAVNAGRMETKANKPADISLFIIRSYYDPASSARTKKKEFKEFKEFEEFREFKNRSQDPGGAPREIRGVRLFLKKFLHGAKSALRPRSS
jgi:hypothetical protein